MSRDRRGNRTGELREVGGKEIVREKEDEGEQRQEEQR